MRGEVEFIRTSVRKLLRETLFFSLLFTFFFYFTADSLACLVYKDPAAGDFIRLLAPLLPFLYTDIVTDGCLKGLGQMMRSMTYNIAEATLGLLLVCTLLPHWALNGYIFVLYICEIFNFALSIYRLYKITHNNKGPL